MTHAQAENAFTSSLPFIFYDLVTKILKFYDPRVHILVVSLRSWLYFPSEKKNMPSHTKQRISYQCKGIFLQINALVNFTIWNMILLGREKDEMRGMFGNAGNYYIIYVGVRVKKWGLRATSDSLGRVIAGTLTPRATELNKKPQTKWHRVWSAAGPNIKSLNARRHALVGVKNISNSSGAAHAHTTILI